MAESTKLAPGEARALNALRDAEPQGLRTKDIMARTRLNQSIWSSNYRTHLLNSKLIEYDSLTRKFHLTESGKEVANTRDDLLVISRGKRILHEEIEPDRRVTVPSILPIDASVYAGPEVQSLIGERLVGTGTGIYALHSDNEEKRHSVIAEIAAPISAHFDTLFVRRFTTLVDDWSVYHLQQMQPTERRRILHRWYDCQLPSDHEEANKTLIWLEGLYMGRKLPEGGPLPLAFDTILDFEAAVVVRVSREKLAKNRERIRHRLAACLLELCLKKDPPFNLSYVEAMGSSGIIATDEFQEYARTKGRKKQLRILRELMTKHAKLAAGPDLGTPKIITSYGGPTIRS